MGLLHGKCGWGKSTDVKGLATPM